MPWPRPHDGNATTPEQPTCPGTNRGLIAHLQEGQLDGMAEDIGPVLAMPPDMRIATVTGWLNDLDTELRIGRHASCALASSLRHQIRDFTATALPSHAKEAG
jgi:hypothetical protein